ncbi:hypothetical protein [Mycobacteroides abscessus]|uniref:hypothetical protein n=1 Tax=Mycobacteroides abscessus TaxID=36809 RepID=UPI0011B258DA|nr:hypothetical protein [Mycobacteroides abscessus]
MARSVFSGDGNCSGAALLRSPLSVVRAWSVWVLLGFIVLASDWTISTYGHVSPLLTFQVGAG